MSNVSMTIRSKVGIVKRSKYLKTLHDTCKSDNIKSTIEETKSRLSSSFVIKAVGDPDCVNKLVELLKQV